MKKKIQLRNFVPFIVCLLLQILLRVIHAFCFELFLTFTPIEN